ncbi:putative short chain dehydrogenase reductase protein [Phaeoacremonium minimum UCRPA7]|uniref:Putative short chain dehydrogenase reductase protein n=1 Tax=Phaeoacremonium minimum (strain UCR-PA7) TaxID=1286976 RepID=R8BA96_PHAM7|nr:putative short chain dehydrogenase reductase protein [Phaeoacremonium minimum UCRPA7]EON96240.1 putative short chain dehydrogenase reductase protein [Phaeoacremonium minimum UCRPA7]
MKVLVADYDDAALQKIGGEISTIKTDVSKLEDWAKLKSKVDQDFNGQVNLLALNAGVGGKSSWEDLSIFHKIIDTNVFGVLNGISTFLPSIKEKAATTPSAIVITGSKQGITNPPGNPAYNLSKAAVKSAAEHLSYDLRGTGIGVHLLVPGWTHTGMTGANSRDKPDGAWWPDQVVDYLEKKMNEGQFWAICPDNDVTEALDRKRMQWTASDAIEGRPPLSRWRDEWKEKHQDWVEKQK